MYLRTKVFLFPSTREGFGMAVVEALYIGLSVVAWRLPIFEELYDNILYLEKLQLVNPTDYQSFAEEASKKLYSPETNMTTGEKKRHRNNLKTWNEIGEGVMKVIEGMNNSSSLI
jgi:glycosyltransferase involved in cell wall biosynthesis